MVAVLGITFAGYEYRVPALPLQTLPFAEPEWGRRAAGPQGWGACSCERCAGVRVVLSAEVRCHISILETCFIIDCFSDMLLLDVSRETPDVTPCRICILLSFVNKVTFYNTCFTFCHMLPHFAHLFPWQFMRGNCGTSATTPSVPTPSGSRRLFVGSDFTIVQGKHKHSDLNIRFSNPGLAPISPWLVCITYHT